MYREGRELVVCNYSMALWINAHRRSGTLEVDFHFRGNKPCYRFTDVDDIDELVSEYQTQREILSMTEEIASMAFMPEY